MPALTRSRRLSRSNSAKIASSPAMARPVGVAKSNASLREITPPPECLKLVQGPDEVS